MKRIQWTARCKSGYTFKGRACSTYTGRGVLLCDACLNAERIPSVSIKQWIAQRVGSDMDMLVSIFAPFIPAAIGILIMIAIGKSL